jgi:hypothetical protein
MTLQSREHFSHLVRPAQFVEGIAERVVLELQQRSQVLLVQFIDSPRYVLRQNEVNEGPLLVREFGGRG